MGLEEFDDSHVITKFNIRSTEAVFPSSFLDMQIPHVNCYGEKKNIKTKKMIFEEGIEEISVSEKLDYLEENEFPKSAKFISDFQDCKNLKKISWYCFGKCLSLKNIDLPESLETIEPNTFSGCVRFEQIVIPHKITSIGKYTFHNCTNLKFITIPSSVEANGLKAIPLNPDLTIICEKGSYAEDYAINNNFNIQYL